MLQFLDCLNYPNRDRDFKLMWNGKFSIMQEDQLNKEKKMLHSKIPNSRNNKVLLKKIIG